MKGQGEKGRGGPKARTPWRPYDQYTMETDFITSATSCGLLAMPLSMIAFTALTPPRGLMDTIYFMSRIPMSYSVTPNARPSLT